MTTFPLRILFHGTVALVPDDELPKCKKMRMLLGEFDPQPGIRDQVAYVRFPVDNHFKPPAGRRIFAPPAGSPSELLTFRHVQLEREEISVSNVDPTQKLVISSTKPGDHDVPTLPDAHSLHWLPTLSRLDAASSAIDTALLSSNDHQGAKARLAGLLEIIRGELTTSGVLPIEVTFANGSGQKLRQAISRDVVLDLQLTKAEFEIKLTKFQGSVQTTLKFTATADKTKPLTLVIGNEPPDDIYSSAPYPELGQSGSEEFRLFYLLSKDPESGSAGDFIPLFNGRGGIHQICANAIFDPSA